MRLRPTVKWFAEQMEAKLRENDWKGGWQALNFRLSESIGTKNHDYREFLAECADVSNFMMMIADNWGREAEQQERPALARHDPTLAIKTYGRFGDPSVESLSLMHRPKPCRSCIEGMHLACTGLAGAYPPRRVKTVRYKCSCVCRKDRVHAPNL